MKNSFSPKIKSLLAERVLPVPILAFAAVKDILQQNNVELLDLLDDDIKREAINMAIVYKKTGRCVYVSNVGKGDQTVIAKDLYELLVKEHILPQAA